MPQTTQTPGPGLRRYPRAWLDFHFGQEHDNTSQYVDAVLISGEHCEIERMGVNMIDNEKGTETH